ncbi:hypothetical protein K6L09_20590 [Burkholderia cepacia]
MSNKYEINKLTINIVDTCEPGLIVALREILEQLERGCYRGGDSYFLDESEQDEDSEYLARGSYEYTTKSKLVTREELEKASSIEDLI